MYHFCTYFDHNYIFKGLALHSSMVQYCGEFTLHILCLSDECYSIMKELDIPNVNLITVNELEAFQPQLTVAKKNRSKVEFYFTCTPNILQYLLNKLEIESVTYVDSDTYFFSSPDEIFNEIKDASVAIVSHRFSGELLKLQDRGKYNVGWLTFKNDPNGLKCLKWYADKCNEWCYDIIEEDRFADQKYLDKFSVIADNVVEIQHLGCDLAPWNIGNYRIEIDTCGNILIDGQRLVMYHFERLKRIRKGIYSTCFHEYHFILTNMIKDKIYRPYIEVIEIYIEKMNQIRTRSLNSIRYEKPSKFLEIIKDKYRKIKTIYYNYKYRSLIKIKIEST